MNILYLTQWFSSIGGGGEVVFQNLANGMARRGHCVNVVCHQLTNLDKNSFDGVSIYRIKPLIEFPQSLRQNILYIVNAILKGSQIIRQKKIDIIHANNFSPIIAGGILGKIHNIPVISTIHVVFAATSPDFWAKWSSQKNISHVSSIIGPLFEKITLRMPTDIIHTVSNATKEDLIRFKVQESHIRVIPNGIDLQHYDNLPLKKDYLNYVIYIGRLVFNKNLDVVITSFKKVTKKLPDAKLIVVGHGPMRDKWEKMVSELELNHNIEFTGHISEEKKLELLSKCSALLLPSFSEGLSLVLLEAFAMSKPVLAADVEASYEIVAEGVDGFILGGQDVDRWSEKIIFLLSNKTVCQNMGVKGRMKVENKFSLLKVLNNMESLYSELKRARLEHES